MLPLRLLYYEASTFLGIEPIYVVLQTFGIQNKIEGNRKYLYP